MNRFLRAGVRALTRDPLAWGLAVYLVLPNLTFVLLGTQAFINRALINGDYLLLWIGACYWSRRTTLVLYGFVFFLDLILSTESIYYFSAKGTILAARDMISSNAMVGYPVAVSLLALALAPLLLYRRAGAPYSSLSIRGQLLVGLAALLISGVSAVRSFGPSRNHFDSHWSDSISWSAIIELGRSVAELAQSSGQDPEFRPATNVATSALRDVFTTPGKTVPHYNILLIVVESEGLLKNASDMRRVFAPLISPAVAAKYQVRTGALRFEGATMSGELRALCQIYVPHPLPGNLPSLQGCLPNALRKLGYETSSYHGYKKYFYERPLWYPALGLQHSYFAEELAPLAPPAQAHCGGFFDGVCDMWIADQIERKLLAPAANGKFIYWVTLDSHLPADHDIAQFSNFDCERTETLKNATGPCDLARIHFQLNERVARIALDRQLPPTRFMLVGDHKPPFPLKSERGLYDDNHVPFVDLTPIPQ